MVKCLAFLPALLPLESLVKQTHLEWPLYDGYQGCQISKQTPYSVWYYRNMFGQRKKG